MATLLTYAQISKLAKPGRYFDGRTGLHLLVRSAKKKYWVFRFTHSDKRRDMGLGVFPRVSLADARRAAQEARSLLNKGTNPLQAADAGGIATPSAQIRTKFKDFSLAYVESKRPEWKSSKHADQWVSTMTEYAFPEIGDKALDEIDTEDILRILQPIWTTKTETASRLRGRIERVLSAATTRKLRTGANPAIWRGHLDTLLAKPRKVTKVKHHNALSYNVVPDFIENLQGRVGVSALALEFAILTAARTNEVVGAKRGEVANGIWTVPADRMKAGKTHRVPLTPRALQILARAESMDPGGNYLFSRNSKPLSNMAMLTMLHRINKTVTVHGFRSTFRDWAAETTKHSPEVSEMALAHTIKNKAEAAYRRGDLLEARKSLMLDWEAYCMGRLQKVIALRVA